MKTKGNSMLSMPIILVFSIICILIIAIFISNIIMTYIWYEKAQSIALKYTYILEEYGYLTPEEKTRLVQDMVSAGFKKENIEVKSTDNIQMYGTQIYLDITYYYDYNIINSITNTSSNKKIKMNIHKVTYSKR